MHADGRIRSKLVFFKVVAGKKVVNTSVQNEKKKTSLATLSKRGISSKPAVPVGCRFKAALTLLYVLSLHFDSLSESSDD